MDKISSLTKINNEVANKEIGSDIISFAKKLSLTDNDIKRNLSSLEDSCEEIKHCKGCKGLEHCKNRIKGYVYYPDKKESNVSFNYIACKHLKKYEEDVESKKGETLLANARMKDIDVSDKNRVKVIKWINDFYHNYSSSGINKGLYLHGTFGSGKTFLLAALLNELYEKKGVNFEIVYYPELLRTLKDNFTLLDNKVKYLERVEILLLDDIGAEKVTDWSRDEILGTILQSRMNNHMTTFFTSNLTLDELEKHLSITKDKEDTLKACRILERIKQLTEDIELLSANRRN